MKNNELFQSFQKVLTELRQALPSELAFIPPTGLWNSLTDKEKEEMKAFVKARGFSKIVVYDTFAGKNVKTEIALKEENQNE